MLTAEHSPKTRNQFRSPVIRPEGCLTPKEAAEFINETKTTLANWRLNSRGPAFHKIGAHVWYRITGLERWNQQRAEGMVNQ